MARVMTGYTNTVPAGESQRQGPQHVESLTRVHLNDALLTYRAHWLEARVVAGLIVLFLRSGPLAPSAAGRAAPSAAASPCFAAAAGELGPEPRYVLQSLLPSDPSTAAPVETKGKVG